jgi:hypothetical protein
MGAVDTALAAQNAVVTLESLGLGAVYIVAIRNKPAEGGDRAQPLRYSRSRSVGPIRNALRAQSPIAAGPCAV